jgi:DNA (cytosine-5)-methyltransferase 1
MTMRLLDLFSGAGGASVGYARAGFNVVGVDWLPQPSYPFPMIQADALEILDDPEFLNHFDAIHASPPCQPFSTLRTQTTRPQPDLIETVRTALVNWCGAYVIENVEWAPLLDPTLLCGSMFGMWAECGDGVIRQLRRHRMFESNIAIWAPGPCRHHGQPVGVYGDGGGGQMTRGYKATGEIARQLLDVAWIRTQREISQAIPPAYTKHVGAQLAARIRGSLDPASDPAATRGGTS